MAEKEEEIRNEKASHSFYKRKTEQVESNFTEIKKQLISAESETNKYKRYLNDIESSLKEVESIS